MKKSKNFLLLFLSLLIVLSIFSAFDITATAAGDPSSGNFITFSSASVFTINAEKRWDGTIEYSTNGTSWATYAGGTDLTAAQKGGVGDYYLCFRGSGNKRITAWSYEEYSPWVINGTAVACSGNIENLLDYVTVAQGNHPTMTVICFYKMFYNCTALTEAPALPATTLTDSCYYSMFSGCTSLREAPALPATTLVSGCYGAMFSGCTSLTEAPALPATTLVSGCYQAMFSGCTSLTEAPALPATALAAFCYCNMFDNCVSLNVAPALPATILAASCYNSMFRGCRSLTDVPALPATILADFCYSSMFSGCTGIKLYTSASEAGNNPVAWGIPSVAEEASGTVWCADIFYGTGGGFTGKPAIGASYYYSGEVTAVFATMATPQAGASPATIATPRKSNRYGVVITQWFKNGTPSMPGAQMVFGETFKAGETYIVELEFTPNDVYSFSDDVTAKINSLNGYCCGTDLRTGAKTYRVAFEVRVPSGNYITFSSASLFSIKAEKKWNGMLMYSTDGMNWATYNGGTELTAAQIEGFGSYYLCFLGTGNTQISATGTSSGDYSPWVIKGTAVACSGDFENLLDCDEVLNGNHPTMADYCFYKMFYGATVLTDAPDLPATTLAESCYESMFSNCTSLVRAPALPATTLASYCYYSMFMNCTSLKRAPALPATTLASYCYKNMFYGCTEIKLYTSASEAGGSSIAWGITAGANPRGVIGWNSGMFSGTGGGFKGSPVIGSTYYYSAPVRNFNAASDATTIDVGKGYIFTDISASSNVFDIVSPLSGYTALVTPSLVEINASYNGTGAVITIMTGTETVDRYILIVMGDVNGDSVCDAIDCMSAELVMNDHATLTDCYLNAADYDNNADISIADFQQLMNCSLSK